MPTDPHNNGKMLSVLDILEVTDTEEAQTLPLFGHPELTLRDEANIITAHAFRCGYLEDLHAGWWSPVLSDPSVSRISDDEMKNLMIETSARLAHWLYVREMLAEERFDVYEQLLVHMRWRYTSRWERTARMGEVPKTTGAAAPRCPECSVAVHDEWRFCPMCGSSLAPT